MDDKLMEDMQKELGKFTRLLSSTNKTIIKNSKSDKMEAEGKTRLKNSMKAYREETGKSEGKVVEFGEEVDEATGEVDSFGKKLKGTSVVGGLLKKGFDFLVKAAIGTTEAIIKTGIEFGKTSSSVKTLSDAVQHGAEALGPLGRVMGGLAGEIDDNVQMFKGLASSGATFGSSIEDMRDAAYTAGMPLVQFQELIQNNTGTLAKMFGSVNAGTPQFVALGREMRRFTENELAGFGLTMDDTNEFLGTYADMMRARGMSENMTSQQLMEGTKTYAKQLTTLSRLTGQSVQELDKQMKQEMSDGVMQAKLAQMSTEEADNFRAMLASVHPEMRQSMKEMVLLGAPMSDTAKAFEVATNGQMSALAKNFTAGGMSIVEFNNRLKTMSSDVVKGGSAFADLSLSGNAFATQMLNIASAQAGQAVDEAEFDKNTQAATQGNTKALVNTQSALEMNTVSMQALGTTMLSGLILDNDALGTDLLQGFVNDGGKTTDEMRQSVEKMTKQMMNSLGGKTDAPEGADPKQSKWYKPWTWFGKGKEFDQGTMASGKLFQDFGTGTPALLHGTEAVVTPDQLSGMMAAMKESMANSMPNLVGLIEKLKGGKFDEGTSDQLLSSAGTTKPGTGSDAGGGSEEIIVLNSLDAKLAQAIEEMRKVNNNLNTGNMISQNIVKTGNNTNSTLANMGGSLV